MINFPVEIQRGTTRVDPAQVPPAWVTIERNQSEGDWMFTADTTAVYYSTDDEVPGAIAGAGLVLPRDDSIVLDLTDIKFHYWIPAGGTLRMAKVTVVR